MKKPKYLYHGSRLKLDILKPQQPSDNHPDHGKFAIYATDKKIGAIIHGVAPKPTECFGERNSLILSFVSGWPTSKTHKYSYVYTLKAKDFKHNVRGEWIATKQVKPIKIEKYKVSDLKGFWRKSNRAELREFLNNRPGWKMPQRDQKTKKEIKEMVREALKKGEIVT
jgi:hypothetical protein